jgi:hypothetical protein
MCAKVGLQVLFVRITLISLLCLSLIVALHATDTEISLYIYVCVCVCNMEY